MKKPDSEESVGYISKHPITSLMFVARSESSLEKLNSSTHATNFATQPTLDFGDKTTFAVKPPTERMIHL